LNRKAQVSLLVHLPWTLKMWWSTREHLVSRNRKFRTPQEFYQIHQVPSLTYHLLFLQVVSQKVIL